MFMVGPGLVWCLMILNSLASLLLALSSCNLKNKTFVFHISFLYMFQISLSWVRGRVDGSCLNLKSVSVSLLLSMLRFWLHQEW